MGLGREVADAYISVHGDLSPFRRELSGADKAMEDLAKKNAQSYGEAWGEHLQKDVAKRWSSIVDTMHSGKKIDLNRMIENFDPTDLDNAQKKLNEFLLSMSRHRKFSKEEYAKVKKELNGMLDGLREQEKLDGKHLEALKENAAWEQRRADTMAEAAAENERWARTLDGIRKNNAIATMESDFRKLAEATRAADMGDFAKSFDTLHEARARIYEVTAAMQQQGRMSAEQADLMHAHIDQFITDEEAKAKAMRDALEEAKKLREEQERYRQSLDGMTKAHHFAKLEDEFRNLAAAMDSNDWSHFAKGADDLDRMRKNIKDTAFLMRGLGRMTEEEYGKVLARVENVTHAFGENERAMNRSSKAGDRMKTVLRGLNAGLRGTREHLQGFAGLNVFGDMIREGLDFIHNLDRIALRASRTATIMGSIGSVGGSSLAGLAVILSDVGATIGGLAAAAPAFMVGTAIGVGVLVAAFRDMKKVLADLKPAFQKLQDTISANFWKQAAGPVRSMVNSLMPLLSNKLGQTATAMGKVFAALSNAVKEIPHEQIGTMFDRMNSAIGELPKAMKPLISAFTTLGMVGSEYFGRFSAWIVKLSTDFDNFIQNAAANGDLNKWIDNMIDGFKNMGRAIDGTFGIFNAIADAARKAGSGGLKEFADKLQAAAAAMQSSRFQDTLTMLFSGMNIAVAKIATALKGLGPAIESVMPSINLALSSIGDVAATIIGYIGRILSNPLVQKGITDFADGMKAAIETLEPAIKPFADSIGNMLTLLGKVIGSVAKIATAFVKDLGPVLDDMSIKVQTLLDPLSNMATNLVAKLKPVAEAFNNSIVAPVVAGLNSSLIPAFNGFVDKAGPVISKMVQDLGPTIKTLVDTTLPNAVKFATELLDPLGKVFALFTPTLQAQIEKIGDGFDSLASAMRIVKAEARPEDWKLFDGGFSAEDAEKGIKETEKKLKDIPNMKWGDILKEIFTGDMSAGFAAVGSKIAQFFASAGEFLGPKIADGFQRLMPGGQFWKDAASNNQDLSKWLTDMIDQKFGKADELNRNIGKWFDEHVGKPLSDWWNGIKGMAQDWFRSTFGFGKDTSQGDNAASIVGGGGAGGRGMGVMGKITDEMLGEANDPKPLLQQWFDGAIAGITDGLARLGDMLGLPDLVAKWNEFWAGFGTTVSDTWTNITTWITEKYTEISTNIQAWFADLGKGWDDFWRGVGDKVREIWDGFASFLDTKRTEISTNITAWIEDVKKGWNDFWTGAGEKVRATWDFVKQWIDQKISDIKTGITTWITDLKTSWNDFWTGAGEKVRATWEFMKQWIAQKIEDIKTGISNWFADLKQRWTDFWTGVGEKIRATWEFMKQWVKTKIEEIKTSITTFVNDTRTNWSNFWNNAGQIVSMAWQWIVTTIRTKINEAIDWVKSLPGRIKAELQNQGNLLTTAGNVIMGGFLGGLQQKWQDVTTFVGTIAQWIKDHKGPISYDRTLLVPAGEAIMSGLESSLKNKFGGVMDFVSSMADLMAGAFAQSKMYLAGADAAKGLADGLTSQRGTVTGALGALLPEATVAANITARQFGGVGGGTPVAGTVVNVGGITLSSPVTDPQIAANKVVDSLINYSGL